MLILKPLSPEIDVIGIGRAFRETRRQHSYGHYWRAPTNTPGSMSISSQRLGLRGNEGYPHHRSSQVLHLHLQTSLNSKDEGMVMGKSESSIRAMKLGNASRAKGRQIEISARQSMNQTLGWSFS